MLGEEKQEKGTQGKQARGVSREKHEGECEGNKRGWRWKYEGEGAGNMREKEDGNMSEKMREQEGKGDGNMRGKVRKNKSWRRRWKHEEKVRKI